MQRIPFAPAGGGRQDVASMRTVTAAVVVVAGLMLGILSPWARGQDEPEIRERAPYSWREAAAKAELTPAQVEQLAVDKLVIASKYTYRQAFEGCLRDDLPLFITSDSILAGYHKLFEESVLRVERARVERLAPMLRTLWAGLDDVALFEEGDRQTLAERGVRRARIVLGVALRLIGDDKTGADDPRVAPAIEALARRAGGDGDGAGAAAGVPKWAGGIDFSRCQPRGFYTRSDALRRYFRAVAWLQAVPFPVADDEALVAILALGRAVPDEPPDDHDEEQEEGGLFGGGKPAEARPGAAERDRRARAAGFHEFFETYHTFVGPSDDWTILRANERAARSPLPLDANQLDQVRVILVDEWRVDGAVIDDGSPIDEDGRPLPNFRVLSALRTPDALLFGRTTAPRFEGRRFPSGLDICAALGAEEARELLRAAHGDELIDVITARSALTEEMAFEPHADDDVRTLYAQYLDCLRPLIDSPEKDAPPLFGSRAWRRKSLQTACGGWAQLRHTWALQAKNNSVLFGGSSPQPGFVEPEPEFFARLAALCERSEAEFHGLGVLGPDFRVRADELREMADRIERKDFAGRGAAAVVEEAGSIDDDALPGELIAFAADGAGDKPIDDAKTAARLAALVPDLRALADALEPGERPGTALGKAVGEPDDPIVDRWRLLTAVSRTLETMAHKQLRGAAWSDRDEAFFEAYGERLCEVMGYPTVYGAEDDAPRAVEVYVSREPGTGQQHLLVATGRPTAMYLLYPWDGGEILCRGVVLPYHEFARGRRLTDDDWRALLDSPDAPALPAWSRELNNHDPEPGRGRD